VSPPFFHARVELLLRDENRVRSDGNQTFSGFLNVTILEMNLVSIHRRNMLMCAEWYFPFPFPSHPPSFTHSFTNPLPSCGVPIFSNTPAHPAATAPSRSPSPSTPGSSVSSPTRQAASQPANWSGVRAHGRSSLEEASRKSVG
jgi:hypothetical protein